MNINTRVYRSLTSRTGALDHERFDRGSRKLRKHGRSHVNVGVVVPERRELRAGCGVNEEWSVETLLRGGKRRKLGRKQSRETLHPRTYNQSSSEKVRNSQTFFTLSSSLGDGSGDATCHAGGRAARLRGGNGTENARVVIPRRVAINRDRRRTPWRRFVTGFQNLRDTRWVTYRERPGAAGRASRSPQSSRPRLAWST